MKMIKIVIGLCICLAVVVLAGCRGSSSSGEDVTSAPTTTALKTGVLKINTSGTQNTIGSVDATVNFPAGVIVDTDATGETVEGVVTVSGAAAGGNTMAVAVFSAASSTTPAQLRIGLVNATGFTLGECATINFKVNTDVATFPDSKTMFSVTNTKVSDIQGNALSGISVEPASLVTGT